MAKNKKNRYNDNVIEGNFETIEETIVDEVEETVVEEPKRTDVKTTHGKVICVYPNRNKTSIEIDGNGYMVKGTFNTQYVEVKYTDSNGFHIVSVSPIM